jgi:hypothetical protein
MGAALGAGAASKKLNALAEAGCCGVGVGSERKSKDLKIRMKNKFWIWGQTHSLKIKTQNPSFKKIKR